MCSRLFPLVRGLVGGFLISLVNGFSLPILFELFVWASSILSTGHWYGPIAIAELWFIQFVFGFGCSLLPSLVVSTVLSLMLFYLSSHTMRSGWSTIFAGMATGIAVTVFYVMSLSYFEIVSVRESELWIAFILIEEICIYGWLASRWGRRSVMRETVP